MAFSNFTNNLPRLYLVIIAALLIAGCSGSVQQTVEPAAVEQTAAPTEEPAEAPTDEPTMAPTDEPTMAPTEEPTVASTEELPQTGGAAETEDAASSLEEVRFRWAPGGVTPSDSDDVDAIILDLKGHEGIEGGRGNEISITVTYDPAVITVEEIAEILDSIGHPVEVAE